MTGSSLPLDRYRSHFPQRLSNSVDNVRAWRCWVFACTGQQVVEEVLDSQRQGCPIEYFNIDIPRCDELFDPQCTGECTCLRLLSVMLLV